MDDLRRFDLNLLVAFDALMAERSVTGAARRIGVASIIRCTRSSISPSKAITPGATEFTVICGASAFAKPLVIMIRPAFEAP